MSYRDEEEEEPCKVVHSWKLLPQDRFDEIVGWSIYCGVVVGVLLALARMGLGLHDSRKEDADCLKPVSACHAQAYGNEVFKITLYRGLCEKDLARGIKGVSSAAAAVSVLCPPIPAPTSAP